MMRIAISAMKRECIIKVMWVHFVRAMKLNFGKSYDGNCSLCEVKRRKMDVSLELIIH